MDEQQLKASTTEEVVMTELVLPQHTNALGTVFGGVVMSWIDIAAAIAATRYCRMTCVTASIDDMHFLAPIRLGWMVQLRARVNYTSRTSMEVGVRVESENPRTGERHHTSSAYLTFVALGEDGKPKEIPKLQSKTPEDKRRWADAEKRRELRLKRRSLQKRD